MACLIVPVVSTTSVILSCNKIRNGDILVSANSGPPGKWWLKQTQSDGWLVDWCSTALKGWMTAIQVCDKKCRNEYGYGILHNPVHAWTLQSLYYWYYDSAVNRDFTKMSNTDRTNDQRACMPVFIKFWDFKNTHIGIKCQSCLKVVLQLA